MRWANKTIGRLLRSSIRSLCPILLLACNAHPCRGEEAIKATQSQLRAWARECLSNKWIGFQQPEYWQDGNALIWFLGSSDDSDSYEGPMGDQIQVEIIRIARPLPERQAFWEPFLRRIELVVAEELAYRALVEPLARKDLDLRHHDERSVWEWANERDLQDYRVRVVRTFDEATKIHASQLGLEPKRSGVPRAEYAAFLARQARAKAKQKPPLERPLEDRRAESKADAAFREAEMEVEKVSKKVRARIGEVLELNGGDAQTLGKDKIFQNACVDYNRAIAALLRARIAAQGRTEIQYSLSFSYVKLATLDGQGTICYLPRSKYLIATRLYGIAKPDFLEVHSGDSAVGMLVFPGTKTCTELR